MKLLKLFLNNYQGINSFELNSNGADIEIKGENGVGKTTIGSAVSWLIFDKPITDEKGYTPKTKDKSGNDLHNLNHSAEGVFKLDNGEQITLKRDFHEVWTKKRGSVREEFSGHIIDHFIDGVPVKEKQYKERLAEIISPDISKILTIPNYFPQTLLWQDRRALLLDICGDITDAAVIASSKELAPLQEFLKKPGTSDALYTVDEYTAIANSQRAKINKDLQTIPARIDEAQKAIPDISGLKSEELAARISEHETKKELAERRKMDAGTSDVMTEFKQQLVNLNLKIAEKESEFLKGVSQKNAVQNAKIIDLQNDVPALSAQLGKLKIAEKEALQRIELLNNKRTSLLADYKAVKSEVWGGETVCRTCGQAIPIEQIETAKEKFNLNKSNRLNELNEKGNTECSKAMIEACEQSAKETAAEIITVEKSIEERTILIERLKGELETATFTDTDEYKEIKQDIARVQNAIGSETNQFSDVVIGIQSEIDEINAAISELREMQSKIQISELQSKRVLELEESEKQLGAEYEKLEQGIYLCQLFTRTKSEMLTESINQKFKNVRFRLFTEQINGGISDCCDVLVPCKEGLVPYQSANTAGRINASLELIDTLGEHYGVTMPIILDNCESVLQPYPTKAQQIRLIVADHCPQLKITA